MTLSVSDLAALIASISITSAAIETGKVVLPIIAPAAAAHSGLMVPASFTGDLR